MKGKLVFLMMGVAVGVLATAAAFTLMRTRGTEEVHGPKTALAQREEEAPEPGERDVAPLRSEDVLKRKVDRLSVREGSVGECFLQLVTSEVAPMGLELIPGDYMHGRVFDGPSGRPLGTQKRFSLSMENATLKEVLDAVVSADPRYKWVAKGGVINIQPKDGRSEVLEQQVDLFFALTFDFKTLMEFFYDPQLPPEHLGEDFVQRVLPQGLEHLDMSFENVPCVTNVDAAERLWTRRMTFILVKPTLRDFLNAILHSQGKGAWLYMERSVENMETPIPEVVLCPDEDTL